MALELMNEHEQGELVRSWLRQNMGSIMVGVLVGLGALVGWQQWLAMRASHQEQAQVDYHELVKALEAGDADKARQLGESLRAKYDDTTYAVLAALREAAEAVKKGDAAAAEKAFAWAHDHATLPALRQLAALRRARFELAQGHAERALALAAEADSEGYAALREEIRGDALVALSRPAEARTAYEAALTALDANAPQRSFIEMKRDDLAVAGSEAGT
jgi:predicted negative regulator of RcsB-dependent stress response